MRPWFAIIGLTILAAVQGKEIVDLREQVIAVAKAETTNAKSLSMVIGVVSKQGDQILGISNNLNSLANNLNSLGESMLRMAKMQSDSPVVYRGTMR